MKARGKREARRQSRKHMIRSAKGAGYESQGKREARRQSRKHMIRSAKGAGYESQGQARSASPLVSRSPQD